MTEEIVITTICLFLWGCVGGFDWALDSLTCISVDIFNFATIDYLKTDDIAPLIERVENILTMEKDIKTYTLDEAKSVILDAFKNKMWVDNKLTINISTEIFNKNYKTFDEAYKLVYKLLIEELLKNGPK